MKIQVTPHTIQIIRDTDINAGEYNVSKCTFEFSNEYQELSNVAVFTNCDGVCVEQAITNNECLIPYEMLEKPGQVKLGVYGYEVEEETLVLRYSPTAQYFNVKNGSYAEGEQPTPPSPSIVEQLQAQITDNRNDINDLQEDVGNIKEDITELQENVSNLQQAKADKSELSQVAFSGSYNDLSDKPFIPTKVSELDNDSGYIDKNVDDLTNYTPTNELSVVATSGSYNDLEDKPDLSIYATTQSLNDEISNRRIADNNLQGQIDAITSSSDVKDIVGTYQELLEYDTSTLGNDDIIKVLEDSTHNDAMTYYRWVISGSSGSWDYIGQEGPYYTKSQTNDLLSAKVGFTDYATQNKGGVIKVNTTYGLQVSGTGVLQANPRTYAQYTSGNDYTVIGKATLENVITGKELTNKTYVDNADNLKEDKANKVTSIDENSTDTQYPSAKCVYDSQEEQDYQIEKAKMVYNALPKVTGEGESVTLNDTAECPMEIELKPSELYQETTSISEGDEYDSPSPDYPQEIHSISGDNEIKVENKNRLDLSQCTFSNCILNNDGSLTSNILNAYFCTINASYLKDYIFTHKGDSITFSADNGIADRRMSIIITGTRTGGSTYQEQSGESGGRFVTLTIANDFENVTRVELRFNRASTKFTDTTTIVKEVMLEQNSTATTYTPHQEQSLPLNLGDLEYCKIGDYEDEFFKAIEGDSIYDGLDSTTKASLTSGMWYLQKNIDKVVLNGSEDWYGFGRLILDDKIASVWLLYKENIINEYNVILSNYFKGKVSQPEFNSIYSKAGSSGNALRIAIDNDIVPYSTSSATAFKTWLSTHNTIVYYVQATPTYTLLNNTLQEQLENIYNHTNSYNEQTNVSQENNDLPFVLKLSAIRDLSTL